MEHHPEHSARFRYHFSHRFRYVMVAFGVPGEDIHEVIKQLGLRKSPKGQEPDIKVASGSDNVV